MALKLNGVPTWAALGVALALVITGGWRWYSSAPTSVRPLTTRGRPAKSVFGSSEVRAAGSPESISGEPAAPPNLNLP